MTSLLQWLTSPEWALIVKALLHTLWQGALLAAGLALLLRTTTDPAARYRLSFATLATLALTGLITWGVLDSNANRAKAASPESPAHFANAADTTVVSVVNETDKTIIIAGWKRAGRSVHWSAWLALVWLVGASGMLGRAIVKVAGAEQLRRACKPLNDERIAGLVTEARRAMKLTRRIRVAVTNQLTSPAVVGVLAPTLILPFSLLTTLSQEQIRFVLLHELAHIRRGDYLANLVQLFAEALLFFNPAVWWISHQVRREREACCDALAIELSGAPADYARTLVSVAESLLLQNVTAAPAFGNERGSSSLFDRVQRLLVPGYRPSLRLTWQAMLTSLVAAGGLLILLAAGTRQTVAATNTLLAAGQTPEQVTPATIPTKPVVISDATNLYTRIYKVSAGAVAQATGNLGPVTVTNTLANFREFFARAGVDLQPPKTMFFQDREGVLAVRASLADLDKVEQAVQALDLPPPQLHIRAKFVEVPAERCPEVFSIMTSHTNSDATITGILTESQAGGIFAKLESMPGVELRHVASVTTLSGRQTQIQMVDSLTVVTNVVSLVTNGVATNIFQTFQMGVGPTLDLVPDVSADGYTILMKLIPTVKEFLGYDEPNSLTSTSVMPAVRLVPLPRFREKQAVVSAIVWDGQTVVIGDLKSEVIAQQPDGSRKRQPDATPQKKRLLIFVTTTLVDPAGNRIHTEEEIPFAKDAVPQQTTGK